MTIAEAIAVFRHPKTCSVEKLREAGLTLANAIELGTKVED